jgi:hypothetical protein
MDLLKIIFALKQERDLIEDVIAQFERLAAGRKRRGRLPKRLKEAESQEFGKSKANKEGQTGVEANAEKALDAPE